MQEKKKRKSYLVRGGNRKMEKFINGEKKLRAQK